MTPGRAVERLRMAVRIDTGGDGWAHESVVERLVPRNVLGNLIRDGLVEMRHTRPARPGDQGFTVWYRPKEETP